MKSQTKTKVRTLKFRKANFQLFKELVNRTPRDKGAEQSWQTFKDAFHFSSKSSQCSGVRNQERKQETSMAESRPAVKLKGRKELPRQWKQGQVTWEEHKDAARLCGDGVRKTKVRLELNLAKDAKNNKQGF